MQQNPSTTKEKDKKVRLFELAKELGVTSKDLMLAAAEMGHKGVRAMTPLDTTLANALRTKLGKGRDLPEEPKPKRAPRPKKTATAVADGDGALAETKPASRARKPKSAEPLDDAMVELKPTATIVKPKPVDKTTEVVVPEPVCSNILVKVSSLLTANSGSTSSPKPTANGASVAGQLRGRTINSAAAPRITIVVRDV